MRQFDAYPVYLDYLDADQGKKLLDVGCGPGLLLKAAEQRGLLTFGIDLSAEAIAIASRTSPKSNVEQGNVTQLKFPERNFDYITCIGVLEHFLDMDQSISELKRVAKDEAQYCIMVPNSRTLYWNLAQTFSRSHRESNENASSLDEWREFFLKYGFKILEVHRDDWQIRKFFMFFALGSFNKLLKTVKKLIWKLIPLKFAHQFIFILEKEKDAAA
jgi:ubiquinone/menaquinone biosynthesis C-methylase UbiE